MYSTIEEEGERYMTRIEYFRKKSTLPTKWLIIGLLFGLFLVLSSILLLLYPFASKERINYFHGQYPILYQNHQQGNALVQEDTVFLPLTFIREFLDDALHYDEKSKSIIITTKDKVIQMPTESLTYYVNEKPVTLQFPTTQNSNGELYVAIEPLLRYYPMMYKRLPETHAIQIISDGEKIKKGTITSEKVHQERFRLRADSTLRSAYVEELSVNESIYIEDETQEYYFIRKVNGVGGYVEKKLVVEGKTEHIAIGNKQVSPHIVNIKGPIQLTWEAVYNKNPDTNQLPEMPGVNVVSPTWFELKNEKGDIKNLGSLEYVKWAKSRGYQIWGLFSNSFDPDLTHETFKDYETRQHMIRQLLHYSQTYQLNGINIDIENVNIEDGPLITQFVREATPLFHESGLTVSMDITFISSSGNWSGFYEREKLAEIVDYLIVMAYDEHWGSSPIAGSVASLPWVEENLNRLLSIVPNEKLILGVPLYTRLWKEEVLTDGSLKVSSKALSMSKIKEWLKENNVQSVYDELTGQNYGELFVKEENVTYKVWLEDEYSLRKRAELMVKYELAGVASWSRFFADDTAWSALNSNESQYTNANED
jgi:spore germination protein YaaH